MAGIEILSEKVIYNTVLPEWCFIVGVIGVFTALVVTMVCIASNHNVGAIVSFVILMCCFLLAGFGTASDKNSVAYIEYKVTIDDSVSMTEFFEQYEILDQEGKIYTVKERE